MLAPVILFVYNRPGHTRKSLQALFECTLAPETTLYIYADGPKEDAGPEERIKIEEVRDIIRSKQWCGNVIIRERNTNQGLSRSILSGVTEIITQHGQIIVLEDDILVSPFFLQYMNEGLNLYRSENKIVSIHGYQLPISPKGLPETFFMKGADCWGWATWEDRWKEVEWDPKKLMNEILRRDLGNEFDVGGAYPYTLMLQNCIDLKNDSWAIRWHASAFLKDKLTVYPNTSLITNIGLDNSGIHSGEEPGFHASPAKATALQFYPDQVLSSNSETLYRWQQFYLSLRKRTEAPNISILRKIISKLRHIKRKIFGSVKSINVEDSWGEGIYDNYAEAKSKCSGYEAKVILDKVKESTYLVTTGKACYERDSFIFREIQENPALRSIVEKLYKKNNGQLSVIDFGGALGSTYNYLKAVWPSAKNIQWHIVEQKHFVECGNESFANDRLHFYYTISEALKADPNIDSILLSGVIEYLPDPYGFIDELQEYGFKHIIIDRTGFVEKGDEFWTIQKVPPIIYTAEYPCFFFNENKFLKKFKNYEVAERFNSAYDESRMVDKRACSWKGFLLVKQNN